MQRVAAKHRVIGRGMVELDERNPSLLNLPIPVPSIPILEPLVSPLIGGTNNNGGGQASPPSNPQPTSTPPSGGGGSGSSGGGSSGGGSSGGGSGSSGGGGNGGGNGNGNGNGGGGGNGGGSTPTTTAQGGGGSTPAPPSSPSPSGNSPAPSGPSNSLLPPFDGGSGGNGSGSSATPGDPNGSGNHLNSGGGQTAPANVGSAPSATHAGVGSSAPAGQVTGVAGALPSDSGSSGYTSSAAAGASPATPTITTGAAVSSHKQLSSGAIAGITVVCLLFLLGLILLLVRRRSIARRSERRDRWWLGGYGSSGSFSIVGAGSARDSQASNGAPENGRMSARSSFATNFDQGLMFRVDSPIASVPEFPPMAEVRERSSLLIPSGGAAARRESLISMMSNGSDPDTQYLVVPDHNVAEPLTPMSVRPFSPSESFAFPKPPAPQQSNSRFSTCSSFVSVPQILTTPLSSAATLVHINSPPRAFTADLPPSATTASFPLQTSTPSVPLSPLVAAENPFADPAKPEFADIETICRPFTPSLEDELAVLPGDRVRVMQVFDDGWAFVEKMGGAGLERNDRGLIPVDCLREAGQALPAFLAQKRVSSYGGADKDGQPGLANAVDEALTGTAI
ncbi:hypothetical protein HYDPIDRAFT_111987 [Hydnomerulius pinastri MD-312]|uniref:SH3 domain-containing protein n=1 Tax=Hydnomerulius pinastri MD-312 TaxID=994086 RepID=A0A0C9VGA8_9AGAM|nr:hypothetical protein HYDPIDRAFT_111987 [Hydnomerulius pinastri MD-312]